MSEWLRSPLNEVATLSIGGTPSREISKYWAADHDNGEPWVSIADLKSNTVLDTKEKITELGAKNSNVKKVARGTMIMSFKLSIGRAAIAGCDLFTNEAIVAIAPSGGKVHPEYLFYVLPGIARSAITDTAVKGATLNKRTLGKLELCFPSSLKIQRRIAEVLRRIDQTIQKTQSLIDKYQQIKAGLMHDLFTRGVTADGKLRPTREQAPELYQETAIGWIPREWRVGSIESLCSQIVDCPHSTPRYVDGGYPCIRTADMVPGQLLIDQAYRVDQIDFDYRTQRLKPQCGDVIYSREGERLGIASPVGNEQVCMGQRVMLLRPKKEVEPDFLLWSMNYPNFYRRVTKGLGATTSPHVNVGDVKAINTPIPPCGEQVLIGRSLNEAFEKLIVERRNMFKLVDLKMGLMHDLLTGKVQVPLEQTEKEAVCA